MQGIDNHYRTLLAQHQAELDEPEAEPIPCVYCGHDTDEDENCTNPNCPEE